MRLVHRLGSFPVETRMVHVGDRGADLFDFCHACRARQTHFLVRGFENRRAQEEGGQSTQLLGEVRSWPSQDVRPLAVPASHGRAARATQVQLSFGKLTVLPPRNEPRASPRAVGGVGDLGLGGTHAGRGRPLGMDSVDLGAHHDARTSLGACWVIEASVARGGLSPLSQNRMPSRRAPGAELLWLHRPVKLRADDHGSFLESRRTNGGLFGPPRRWSCGLENPVEGLVSCPSAA
jgi:hypothetical protein